MTVIFRPITQVDLDHFFALKEADKFAPYLFMCAGTDSRFLEQGVQIAIDDTTGNYLIRMPQGDRLDNFYRYVLVCDEKIIVSKAMPSVHEFDVEYLSPSLASKLDALTSFMREAFSNGGNSFFDFKRPKPVDDLIRALGAQMSFVFANKAGEK
jgi:sugar/nucleoside kinase (ribokinase family)